MAAVEEVMEEMVQAKTIVGVVVEDMEDMVVVTVVEEVMEEMVVDMEEEEDMVQEPMDIVEVEDSIQQPQVMVEQDLVSGEKGGMLVVMELLEYVLFSIGLLKQKKNKGGERACYVALSP